MRLTKNDWRNWLLRSALYDKRTTADVVGHKRDKQTKKNGLLHFAQIFNKTTDDYDLFSTDFGTLSISLLFLSRLEIVV
jgi:hypothetical protein